MNGRPNIIPVTIAQQEEARRQLALADVVLLTKTDLVTPAAAGAVERAAAAWNPVACVRRVTDGMVDDGDIFGLAPSQANVARWLNPGEPYGHRHFRQDQQIASVLLTHDRPVRWAGLRYWGARSETP